MVVSPSAMAISSPSRAACATTSVGVVPHSRSPRSRSSSAMPSDRSGGSDGSSDTSPAARRPPAGSLPVVAGDTEPRGSAPTREPSERDPVVELAQFYELLADSEFAGYCPMYELLSRHL